MARNLKTRLSSQIRHLRRPKDPLLGDDRRHQVEGRGVEGRVVDFDSGRGELSLAQTPDLVRVPLLDLDLLL